MSTKRPTCPVCGDAAELMRAPFVTHYNGLPITIPDVESIECAACGERSLSPAQAEAVSVAVKARARSELGVLQPEEVAAIRHRLGLSQSELEELLGLGPQVVTRWETGRVVPGRAADTLLRVLDADPGVLDTLRRIHRRRGRPAAPASR